MSYCTNCGTQINETDKFCSNCGEKIQKLNWSLQEFLKNNPPNEQGLISCPRCLGNGYVDQSDIQRLSKEDFWLPGDCQYCEGVGKINPEKLNNEPLDMLPEEMYWKMFDEDIECNDFFEGNPNGKGKLILANGDIYEGDFVDGERHGKGKITYANGSIYEGDIENGFPARNGKLTLSNGDIYEMNLIDSKVKCTFSNGVYDGDFVDGRRTGKGRYTFDNGDVYEGDFVDGEQHGKGKVTFANGNIYEGDFVKGQINGYGRQIQDNGTYIGHFVNGLLDGNVIFVDNDGKESLGRSEKGNFIPSDLNTNESSNNDSSPIKFKDGAGIR